MKRLLLVLMILVFVASCAKEGGQKGGYVIKIDGTTLTKENVQAEMNTLPEMAKEFFQGPEGMQKFIDELVKKELLYIEAKKRGMDKDKEFQRKLEEFKKIALINQMLEKEIEGKTKITDKDVKDYYDNNKDHFMISNQVRMSQIVVKSEGDVSKVYERLKNDEPFAKVAAEMSTDKASAKSGGDLGSFKRGEMAPELEEVAFKLKKGEISNPITLKDGVHILKITDAKGSVVEFDKVKGFINQQLTAERQKEGFNTFIEGLKKNYKIDINKDAVSKLTFAPTPPPAPAPSAPSQKPEKK